MKFHYPDDRSHVWATPIFRPEQVESIETMVEELTEGSMGVLQASDMGVGKAQPLDSKVLTPAGFVRMGDMEVGQEVVSPDGSTTKVIGVFPQGDRPVYELTFVDGRTVRADEGHVWSVSTYVDRHRGYAVKQRTTKELLADLRYKNGDSRWSVETAVPVDLGHWSSTIDPYLLGVLLGDGCIRAGSPELSTGDPEILDSVSRLLPEGITAKYEGRYDYRLSGLRGQKNALTEELRRLGVWGTGSWDKFVPDQLLESSKQDRISLLQGLLDTDGFADRSGFEFVSASHQLADDVVWLTHSLAGRAQVRPKVVDGKTFWRVWGKLPNDTIPFRLSRKVAKMKRSEKYPISHLAIKSIEFVGMEPTQCILVESDLHEYVTDNFVRTHNTPMMSETVVRLGLGRVLYIGVKETFDEWRDTLGFQSDGGIALRSMSNDSKSERQNFQDFLNGAPGHFFCSSQFLATQDWTRVPVLHKESGLRQFEVKKSTGEMALKPYRGIGPRSGPVWQTRRKQLNRYRKVAPVDMIVFDEVHVASNRKSNATGTLRSITTNRRVGMSGTFYGNGFVNAHTVCRWVWPDEKYGIDPRLDYWIAQWCETETTYAAGGRAVKLVKGERNRGAFVASLPCYIRLESAIGPAPEPEVLTVDLSADEMRDYLQMEEESLFWLQSHTDLEPVLANLPIVQRQYLRSATLGTMRLVDGKVGYDVDALYSTKEVALASVLRRPDWVGKSALIYAEDKRILRAITERMARNGLSVAMWSGDLSSTRRREVKRAFIAGEIQYLVAVISSIGTGTNRLQKRCSRIVWVGESENAKDNAQGVTRVWRDGGDLDDFQQVKLVARDTIDEGVLARNALATVHARETMRIAA